MSVTITNIKRYITQTTRSRFVRNVAVVASGTVGAQAITMAFFPVITRLYGPEAFGLLGVFMALMAVLSPAAALSYPIAIVLPRSDSDAKGLARISAYTAFALALLVTAILLSAGDRILNLLGAREISGFALLLPVAMFFAALMQIAKQWVIRKKYFGISARAEVLHSLLVNTTKAGIGWFYPLAALLIVLTTIGNVIHAGILAIGIKRFQVKNTSAIQQTETKTPLWDLARKYRDFPFYQSPQELLNAVSQSLPVLILAAFFGPASAGFYALCRKVLGLPSILVGKSVGDVFYSRINTVVHDGENLTNFIVKGTLSLATVGFFPFSVVIAFGPWLFEIIFGNEWMMAGEYSRWVALWLFFAFLNPPSVKAIIVMRKQHLAIAINAISIVLRLGALLTGAVLFNSELMAIVAFSAIGVLHNIAFIFTAYIISQQMNIKSSRIA